MTTMKQFRWFWTWDDGKEEIWLREMSQKGWHFQSVEFPGNYIFERGEATNYVYRLDHLLNREDMPGYLQIFEDAGWDYMGEMNSWQYFRQEATHDQDLEIFTDNESKAKKYQRIIMFLVIFSPALFIGFLSFIKLINEGAGGVFIKILAFIVSVVALLYIYVMANLIGRITQLLK